MEQFLRSNRPLPVPAAGASSSPQSAGDETLLLTGSFKSRGVIGVGEPCTIPTASAIANAVANALGVRVASLPITPDKVLAALGLVPKTDRGSAGTADLEAAFSHLAQAPIAPATAGTPT